MIRELKCCKCTLSRKQIPMKFLDLGCPQKPYKICKALSYSRFLCKYDVIKLKQYKMNSVCKEKIQRMKKKLATKERNERKKCLIREDKFWWNAWNWIIRKVIASCKFLGKLPPTKLKLIFHWYFSICIYVIVN